MPSKRTTPRTCERCGSQFFPANPYQKGRGRYCGRECFAAERRVQVARTCDECGGAFTVDPSRLRTHPARYCSSSCNFTAKNAAAYAAYVNRMLAYLPIEEGCWDWTGAPQPNGYGRVKIAGVTKGAHVAAWELASGQSVPEEFSVLHTCDRRICVRNDEPGVYVIRGIERPRFGHLWLGTHADNMADKADKGRQPVGDDHYSRRFPERLARGAAHGRSRLNPRNVMQHKD